MKVIKESIKNVSEVEKKAQEIVDPVMADAKEFSDAAEKEYKEFYDTKKLAQAEPITGHSKKDYPKKIQEPKATLDESLFEDIDNTNIYVDASASRDGHIKSVERLLDNIRGKIYYFGSRVSTNPLEARGATHYEAVAQHVEETKPDNVVIFTDGDIDYYQVGSKQVFVPGNVQYFFADTAKQHHYVPVMGEISTKASMLETPSEPEPNMFGEGVEEVQRKEDALSEHNFEYALNSEEDRQNAIDDCNQVLNVLNNVSVEDIEDAQSMDIEEQPAEHQKFTFDETDDDDFVDEEPPVEEDDFEESLNEGSDIKRDQERSAKKTAKKYYKMSQDVQNNLLKGDVSKNLNDITMYNALANSSAKEANMARAGHDDKGGMSNRLAQDWKHRWNEVKKQRFAFAESCDLINYTAHSMLEVGLNEEIQTMRTRALSEDFTEVCGQYLDECNRMSQEYDDDYIVEGLAFVTQGITLDEGIDKDALEQQYLGKMIRINQMINPDSSIDDSDYNGKEGTVEFIDDMGQLFGDWGSLAAIPEVDDIEIIG